MVVVVVAGVVEVVEIEVEVVVVVKRRHTVCIIIHRYESQSVEALYTL